MISYRFLSGHRNRKHRLKIRRAADFEKVSLATKGERRGLRVLEANELICGAAGRVPLVRSTLEALASHYFWLHRKLSWLT